MTSVAPEKKLATREAITPSTWITPFDEIDRLLETLVPRDWMRPFRWDRPTLPAAFTNVPKVDVIERDSELVLRAELPGIDKKDIDVSITTNAVTLTAKTEQTDEKEEKGEYFRREIVRGAFARTIHLPNAVDPNAAKATLTDGVLEVVIPKVEVSKRRSVRIA